MSVIIGVDIGTSVTKAVAFDSSGAPLGSADRRSHLHRLSGSRVEQDLDDVVRTVAEVVRETAAALPEPPTALALTGQGDGLWLRDADGRAVRPAISWMDGRASDRVARWLADGTVQQVYGRTGSGMFPGCHAPLLAHLQEHEPQTLRRAATAGYCVDAVAQRLTGRISVDASDATLPFLDPVTRTYSHEALAACGIEDQARLLPAPAEPGTVLTLDAHGADLLGLPAGTPLTAGPYDLPACAIGSGVRDVGDGLLIVGTTLACQVLTDQVRPDRSAEPAGMWLCTPDPGRWLRSMPAMVGTAALEWVLALTGSAMADLDRLLADSPPGANGVTSLPFLSDAGERAPFVDPRATGRLDGLTLAHTRADAVRAMCEAIGYAARHCLEAAGLTGTLAACGGGTRSGPWVQLFADVLGREIRVPVENEVGALGAVRVARRFLGEPAGTAPQAFRAVQPRRGSRAVYEDGYAAYRTALAAARDARWGEPGPQDTGEPVRAPGPCLSSGNDRCAGGAPGTRAPAQANSRSSTTAMPSSSFDSVTSSAAALSSGWALAMATPCPERWNMGRSLGMSPNAIVCIGSSPHTSAASASPVPLSTPCGASSTVPGPAIVTVARSPVAARAAAVSSSSESSGWRTRTLMTGAAHSSARSPTRTAGSPTWAMR